MKDEMRCPILVSESMYLVSCISKKHIKYKKSVYINVLNNFWKKNMGGMIHRRST